MKFNSRALRLLFIFTFSISIFPPVTAVAHVKSIKKNFSATSDYCERLQEVNGIIVKFKKIPANKSTGRKTLTKTYGDHTVAKTYLEKLLSKNLSGIEPVYKGLDPDINTLTANSKMRVKNPKRHKKLMRLHEVHQELALDHVYVIHPAKTSLNINFAKRFGLNFGLNHQLQTGCGTDIEADIKKLNADPNIEYAEPNYIMKTNEIRDPFYKSFSSWHQGYEDLWGIKKIKADEAWSISKGEGIVVAVMDTGVDYNHPDLWDNIWVDPTLIKDRNADGKVNLYDMDLDGNKTIDENEYIDEAFGKNFSATDERDTLPVDRYGHGTHVAGTIAAVANNIGVVGVAPEAKVVAIKVLDDSGAGSIESIAKGVVYAASVADVGNSSLGGPGYSKLLEEAYNIAYKLGMVNLVAAGNDADNAQSYSPSNFDKVITVSASTENDTLANFSNYGARVDIAAPGGSNAQEDYVRPDYNILSTGSKEHVILGDVQGLEVEDRLTGSDIYTYVRLAGTSMATPHAAGLAALILSRHPEFSPDEVKAIIRYAVDPLTTDRVAGSGRINALKALQLNSVPPVVDLKDLSNEVSAKISVKGTVSSPTLVSYTLSYKSVIDTDWHEISSSSTSITDNLIAVFDVDSVADGTLIFKLEATDAEGLSSVAFTQTVVRNNRVLSPTMADVYRAGSLIPVELASRLNNLSSVKISYSNLNENRWHDISSSINKKLKTDGSSHLIGMVDSSILSPDKFYDFKIDMVKTDGSVDSIISTAVYVDSLLKPGFPIDLNYHEKKHRESPFLSEQTLAYINRVQAIQVADLDGDGDKEIVTIKGVEGYAEGGSFKEVTGLSSLQIFSSQGALELKTDLHNLDCDNLELVLTIDDIDGDNKKEILLNCADKTYAFNGSGKVIRSWPFILDASQYFYNSNFQAADPVVVDLDNDANKEIVIYHHDLGFIQDISSPKVHLLTILDSHAQIKKQISFPACELNRSVDGFQNGLVSYARPSSELPDNVAIGNFDDDVDKEMVLAFDCNKVTVINADGSNVSGWPRTVDWMPNKFVAGDVDHDGYDEISFVTNDIAGPLQDAGYLIENQDMLWYLIDKKANDLEGWPIKLWTRDNLLNINSDEGNAVDGSVPVMSDMDADGDLELMLPCSRCDYVQYAVHHNGQSLAGFPIEISSLDDRYKYNYSVRYQRSNQIADLQGDGKLDIVNVSEGYAISNYLDGKGVSSLGGVFAWNNNGKVLDLSPNEELSVLYKGSSLSSDYYTMGTIVDDIDRDGKIDLLSSLAREYEAKLVKDVSGNLEINDLMSKFRSRIYAWDLGAAAKSSSISWSREGFDIANSSSLSAYKPAVEYVLDDMSPPSKPGNLKLKINTKGKSPAKAVLTWSKSTDDGAVVAYRVYNDDRLVATVNKPKYVGKISSNKATRYQVSAIDWAGKESEKGEINVSL